MVQYSEDRKFAYFGGLHFCRDEKTGYYLNATRRKRLHRYVYECEIGTIPRGMQIHHKDHNKGNNEPDNLELLTKKQHSKLHGAEMTDEQRARRRLNMIQKAIPAAAEWHKSDAAKEWHKEHYEKVKDKLYVRFQAVCKQCGKEFDALNNGRNVFCSNACKSAWRRSTGVDDVVRTCAICGKTFETSKYSKQETCSGSCANKLRWRKRRSIEVITDAYIPRLSEPN